MLSAAPGLKIVNMVDYRPIFVEHTPDTAPSAARSLMARTTRAFGFLPAPVALMAESPQLLDTFLAANALFTQCSLSQLEREVIVLTIATRVECHYCVAMHSAILTNTGVDGELLSALREARRLPDPKLEALRTFTLEAMDAHGAVPTDQMRTFLDAGYTSRSALDVVLGLGVYTLSTYANRMTNAPVDEPFRPFIWHPHG